MQPRNAIPQLPVEIWQRIVNYHTPSREDYAVKLPWKRSARDSTLVSLTQVCSAMRQMALPLIWAIVYVETILAPLCMDHLQEQGRDLLWYAFVDRRNLALVSKSTYRKLKRKPDDRLGYGPDGHGPDAIIHSREEFLQACRDISSTWTKRLQTIYWDATTTFPEEVILNIRDIQEASNKDETPNLPGLQHLCIDYIERTTDEQYEAKHHVKGMRSDEHARRVTFFNEPIWKLGPTTLKKLKFFSLAPPFWPNLSRIAGQGLARSSPSRLFWETDTRRHWEHTGRLEKPLEDYAAETGPAQYYKTLQSIRPEIFFSTSQLPFHCRYLLPCWAQLRCIHIFRLVSMTNHLGVKGLDCPEWAEFYRTEKVPDSRIWGNAGKPDKRRFGSYLRGAIQLRPALELLSKRLGGRALTGEDIILFATTDGRPEENGDTLQWTEDWKFSWYAKSEEGKMRSERAVDLFSAYKEWLQDRQLADEVAQSFNEGVKRYKGVSYPFCHSETPGKVYFETSLCESLDGKVWLDRPKHRGAYSNINVEGYPKRRYHCPADTSTLHPDLQLLPHYLPSL